MLAEILEVSVDNPDEQTFGTQVQALLQSHSGATELLERCQEITTYNSDNYLPLIRHFFGRYRPLLFELVRSLELQSTSQDRSLPVALEFVLKHEQRRSMILRSRNYELNVCFPQMKQPSDIGNSPNISIVMQKSEHRLVNSPDRFMEPKSHTVEGGHS